VERASLARPTRSETPLPPRATEQDQPLTANSNVNRDVTIGAISDRSTIWDCLVIGGGATGLGSALEAASRGYKVLLVEKHDFAKGTSSRATKLVHGGVRYLEQGDIHLVREALRERGLLLRNAAHLAHPLQFVIPAYHYWQIPFYGADEIPMRDEIELIASL